MNKADREECPEQGLAAIPHDPGPGDGSRNVSDCERGDRVQPPLAATRMVL